MSVIGQIFRKADRVLIWLGEAADGSDKLMENPGHDFLPQYRKGFRRSIDSWIYESALGRMFFRRLTGSAEEQYKTSLDLWAASGRRPYWTRTWIIQEVMLAKDVLVHCGNYRVTWDRLTDSIKEIFANPHTITIPEKLKIRNALRQAHSLAHQRSAFGTCLKPVLRDMLRVSVGTKCADIRDRIYSVLPATEVPPGRPPFAVDYTIDVIELFFRAFEWCYVPSQKLGYARVTEGWRLRQALDLDTADIEEALKDRPEFLERIGCSRDDLFKIVARDSI